MMSLIQIIVLSVALSVVATAFAAPKDGQASRTSLPGELGGLPLERAGLRPAGFIRPSASTAAGGKANPWCMEIGHFSPEVLERLSELPVGWTRLSAGWPDIERQRGVYDFEKLADQIREVRSRGIKPYVTLKKGNLLYTPALGADRVDLYGTSPAAPVVSEEAMAAWLRFVEATVEHFKNDVDHWEIWNEPNHSGFWLPEPGAEAYAKLAVPTIEVIRRVDPDAEVIVGATAGPDAEFIDGFLSRGLAERADIVSFHDYRDMPEGRLYAYNNLRAVLHKHNPKLRLWQGETGYPSHSSTTGSRRLSPWGLNIQAKWLLRQGLTDLYLGQVELTTYFRLSSGSEGDSQAVQERPEPTAEEKILGYPDRGGSRVRKVGVNEKSLLHQPSKKPKPGFYAYQNLASVLDGRYRPTERAAKVAIRVEDEGDFSGISHGDDVFPSVPIVASFETSEGRELLAYWLPWKMQEHIANPATVTLHAAGVVFDEPVLVNPLSGRVYEITNARREQGGTVFTGLPMGDWPLLIAERSQVETVMTRDFE